MNYRNTDSLLQSLTKPRPMQVTAMAAVIFTWLNVTAALELDVPYVETPDDIVELMLDMADITPTDHVIDLGTGDGRIVIAAVKRGASGLGVDLDPQRIQEAELNASKAGVSDRIKFAVQDLFETDISQATVVTLFLNSEVNMRLRPALFEQLKPGTRIVSHNFDMEDWQPDRQEQLMVNNNNNFYIHDIFYWVMPADFKGQWQWEIDGEKFQMTVNQQYQTITTDIQINQQALVTDSSGLSGDAVTLDIKSGDGSKQYTFKGRIKNNHITGTARISSATASTTSDWSASRQPVH